GLPFASATKELFTLLPTGTLSETAPFLGWVGNQHTAFGVTYYDTALYLGSVTNVLRHGNAELTWGTYRAPAAGSYMLSFGTTSVRIEGSTHVKGHCSFICLENDANVFVNFNERLERNGQTIWQQNYTIESDSTKSEDRTRTFT